MPLAGSVLTAGRTGGADRDGVFAARILGADRGYLALLILFQGSRRTVTGLLLAATSVGPRPFSLGGGHPDASADGLQDPCSSSCTPGSSSPSSGATRTRQVSHLAGRRAGNPQDTTVIRGQQRFLAFNVLRASATRTPSRYSPSSSSGATWWVVVG
jgi:hypothetical protein